MSKIDILCLSHGNESLGSVHDYFSSYPVKNVRSHIANPWAATKNKRFLGSTEIMCHYPGDLTGDPEDVAAAQNILWLGDHVNNKNVIIYDLHSNTVPGSHHYFEVGSRALKAGIVGAYLLGYSTCIVRPDSFYANVPNAIILETPISNKVEEKIETMKLCQGIAQVAALDIKNLREKYDSIWPKLTFFTKHELLIEHVSGQYSNNIHIIENLDLLHQLEAIPWQPPMTEIILDTGVRTALGLKNGRTLVEFWSYNNMSPDLQHRGSFHDRPRKLVLGSLLQEIEPVNTDHNWVTFP